MGKKNHKFIFLFALFCVLLSGCAVYEDDPDQIIESALTGALAEEVPQANHSNGYYSWYAEPAQGRMNSDRSSSVLNLRGSGFVMNLNVSSIINGKYYEDAEEEGSVLSEGILCAYRDGSYKDASGSEKEFAVSLYEVDGEYFIHFVSPYVTFEGKSGKGDAKEVLHEMMKVARSVRIHEDEIAAAYSEKETITYETKKLELFNASAPESGNIEELFVDANTIGETGSGGTEWTGSDEIMEEEE